MQKKIIFVVVILTSLVFCYFFYDNLPSLFPAKEDKMLDVGNERVLKATNPYDAGSELVKNDPAYAKAASFLAQYDPESAEKLLREASVSYATGTPERNVIDLDRGRILAFGPNPIEGIVYLKNMVIQSDAYVPLTRALAIETIARINFVYHDQKLQKEIFTGDFFAPFLEQASGDYDAAVIRMLRAGVDIHPTPVTAVRIALFDAVILNLNRALTEEKRKERIADYRKFIQLGDEQIALIEGNTAYNSYVAEYFSVKANAITKVALAGEEVSISEIDALYKKAYNMSRGSAQVYAAFHYAVFLAHFMPTEIEKIEDLGSKIVERPLVEQNGFKEFIKNTFVDKNKDAILYKEIDLFAKNSKTFAAYVADLQISQ